MLGAVGRIMTAADKMKEVHADAPDLQKLGNHIKTQLSSSALPNFLCGHCQNQAALGNWATQQEVFNAKLLDACKDLSKEVESLRKISIEDRKILQNCIETKTDDTKRLENNLCSTQTMTLEHKAMVSRLLATHKRMKQLVSKLSKELVDHKLRSEEEHATMWNSIDEFWTDEDDL